MKVSVRNTRMCTNCPNIIEVYDDDIMNKNILLLDLMMRAFQQAIAMLMRVPDNYVREWLSAIRSLLHQYMMYVLDCIKFNMPALSLEEWINDNMSIISGGYGTMPANILTPLIKDFVNFLHRNKDVNTAYERMRGQINDNKNEETNNEDNRPGL